MSSRIAVACVGVVVLWVVASVALGSLEGPCNPNDLTGCGKLGELVLLTLMIGLPTVFLVLVGALVFRALDARRRAREDK